MKAAVMYRDRLRKLVRDKATHEPERSPDTVSTDVSEERTLSPGLLEIDYLYEAVSHSRRRYLCYTLHESTEWSLTGLATKTAAWENAIPEHEVTDQQREQVYVALYHAHIPKLVDEGVITFDEATETIAAADHADQVLLALDNIGASLDAEQETHAREEMDDYQ